MGSIFPNTIDAEVGQLEVDTFEIREGSRKAFSTERDVFFQK